MRALGWAFAAIVTPFVGWGALAVGCGTSGDTSPAPAPSTSGSSDAGPDIVNACNNPKDKIGVFRSYCVVDPYEADAADAPRNHQSFAELSSDCAKFCVLNPAVRDDPTCVRKCLERATGGAITSDCLTCREQMVACGRKYCIAECAPGPLEVKCLQCMCGDNEPHKFNCYDPYNRCSGLGLTYCHQLDAGTFDGFPPPNDAGACD